MSRRTDYGKNDLGIILIFISAACITALITVGVDGVKDYMKENHPNFNLTEKLYGEDCQMGLNDYIHLIPNAIEVVKEYKEDIN